MKKLKTKIQKIVSRNHCYYLTVFGIFFLFSSLAFAAAPTVGSISPSSGSILPNTVQTFTCTYSDKDGWANLKEAYLLISTNSTTLNCSVYLYYNQNSNLMYLRNDANTVWLGGYAPGSMNTVENSQVKVNYASSKASGSKNTLTVSFNLTFKSAYSGKSYVTYLKVTDDTGGIAGWTSKGTYTINNPPLVGDITPSSGTNSINVPQTFKSTYTDLDGALNIQEAYLLINTSKTGTNCLYVYYNQPNNKLYLRNDANSSWLGGYAPGSANTIENPYAKLNCISTNVLTSGNTLTLSCSVIFKSTFTGNKNIYLYTKDAVGVTNGWTQKGVWSIQKDTVAPTGSIKINNDAVYINTVSVTLNLSAQDNAGGSGMGTGAQMQFSNDNATWSAPENYAGAKVWNLSSGDGTKTVYVKFKDVAGNWSPSYSDMIILDTTAPQINIISPLDNEVIKAKQ